MYRLLNFILVFMLMDIISSVRVKHAPSLMGIPKIKQMYVAWPANTPLSLKCKAVGEPPLNIRWYKNGMLLKPSANVFQDQKWNLKFRRPQLSDNGVYTCLVSNDYGWIKQNYSLEFLQRIHSAPVLVTGYPKPVTVRAGDDAELECLEKPNSQVSDYRWLKTDSLIKANHTNPYEKDNGNWLLNPQKYMYRPFKVQHGETELNGVKLELKRVTEKDMGYYTCFVSNTIGVTFGTAFLNVRPILPTDPPEFLIPKHRRQHFIASVEGEDVTFSCLVRGGAPLKYHWFFNEKLLKSDEEHEIRKSQLLVRHTKLADSGVYTCRIKNHYGHVKHNIALKVLPAEPSHPDHPVLLPGYPKDTKALIGGSASLYCADTGDNIVDYRWLKWNSSVKSFTKADLLNGTLFTILRPVHYEQPAYLDRGVFLKLTNLTMADQGLYTCLAMSVHMGFSYRSAFLTVNQPFKKHYGQQIHFAWFKEESTEKAETIPTTEITSTPNASHHCFDYDQDVDGEKLVEGNTKCETTAPCASMFDEKTSEEKMFCDEQNLCGKHNITSGKCVEITFGKVLCCCVGELCNQPASKLFLKTNNTRENSSKSHLTPAIFFFTFVLIISLMLALLGYRIRQRKAALQESIVHKTRPNSRKMTKQKIMETRWIKEDI